MHHFNEIQQPIQPILTVFLFQCYLILILDGNPSQLKIYHDHQHKRPQVAYTPQCLRSILFQNYCIIITYVHMIIKKDNLWDNDFSLSSKALSLL